MVLAKCCQQKRAWPMYIPLFRHHLWPRTARKPSRCSEPGPANECDDETPESILQGFSQPKKAEESTENGLAVFCENVGTPKKRWNPKTQGRCPRSVPPARSQHASTALAKSSAERRQEIPRDIICSCITKVGGREHGKWVSIFH